METPLHLLHRNMQALVACGSKRVPVVLLTTGALNPVHRMHIGVFARAKQSLEETGKFAVVAGFLSPSHDEYVMYKLKDQGIPAVHRIEMVKLSCAESTSRDWLTCDPWEGTYPGGFVDFPSVLRRLDAFLVRHGYVTSTSAKQEYPLPRASDDASTMAPVLAGTYQPIRVQYLCGADLFLRCGLMKSLRENGVVCVARGDGTGAAARKHADLPYVHFVESETPDMSSTLVRERLVRGEPLDDLMFPSAVEYLRKVVLPQMPALQPKQHS